MYACIQAHTIKDIHDKDILKLSGYAISIMLRRQPDISLVKHHNFMIYAMNG